MFRVIYLWRGERHEHSLRFDRKDYAEGFAASLRRQGWQAWIDRIH